MINPKDFFRFSSDYFNLLKDLHSRRGVNDAELRNVIKRHRMQTSPSVEYIANQLTLLGILETTPYATANKELTLPVRKFLDFLLREQQLTPFAVLGAYLNALAQMAQDLDDAVTKKTLIMRCGF